MALFNTNLEVKFASEAEIEHYYAKATNKINVLLAKYAIRNAEGEFERVCADQCKALLSFTGFFGFTPLKSIFFDQKQPFVPQEIIHAFRSIISNPPAAIKAVFFNTFITLLIQEGWDKPLSTYFEKQYHFPSDGIILLDDLKDFSLGSGVYSATFQLRSPRREKVMVFLKRSQDMHTYHTLLYFHLQKALLSTASHAKMPCLLSNKKNTEALLLSPLIPGVTSDTTLSLLTEAYRKAENNHHKITLKKALEILIEAFIHHATLGDLLGRNDRHLMNSLLALVIDGIPQTHALEDLIDAEKIVDYAHTIVTQGTKAISLIDIDLKWLLDETNAAWALTDIDFGLSELNLLSLLPEFNDCHSKNAFFEKRKAYIAHYFTLYCKKQDTILEKKEFIFAAIKKIYPAHLSEKKLTLLAQRIKIFEKSKAPVIKIFKRYLLNFRIRLAHKETLIALDKMAKESKHITLLHALKETGLLKYLPPQSTFISNESSVLLQLQCFRGVLSKKDSVILSGQDREIWETVAANISMVAKTFNHKLFRNLEDKKRFIKKDSTALLKHLLSSKPFNHVT